MQCKRSFITNYSNLKEVFMRRLKEIWKETIKKHLEKWRRLPGMATHNLNGYAKNRLYFYTIKETV